MSVKIASRVWQTEFDKSENFGDSMQTQVSLSDNRGIFWSRQKSIAGVVDGHRDLGDKTSCKEKLIIFCTCYLKACANN